MRMKQSELPVFVSYKSSKLSPNASRPHSKKVNVVFLLIAGSFSVYCFIILYFAWPILQGDSVGSKSDYDMNFLQNLVNMQNKTIHGLLKKMQSLPKIISPGGRNSVSPRQTQHIATVLKKTSLERDCESRYGMQLVDDWRSQEQEWCRDGSNSLKKSSLKCYPYQQKHRSEQLKGKDIFCVAENFVVDFSLIYGEIAADNVKVFYQMAYLDMLSNSVMQASCRKTSLFDLNTFGPHNNRYFTSFVHNIQSPPYHIVEETPTYFLPRDEDCENAFHSTADFMNMFLVQEILQLDVSQQQVVIMDKMPDTPFNELLHIAFAPVHGVHRHTKYTNQRVMFSKLIFHLESSASLVFPETSTSGPTKCRNSGLFDNYRRHVLDAFNLLDISPPRLPTATMILRHRTFWKNVGRVMANEQDVIDAIQRQGRLMHFTTVDLATMSYRDQLEQIRRSNILVGVHGAGLTWILFAAEEAVLVEIHPSYREDRHFRHLARLAGKDYLPLRSLTRETCVQTSDNVVVPLPAFVEAMDSAVRLAHSYHDGVLECGLSCPAEIVAMRESEWKDAVLYNQTTTNQETSSSSITSSSSSSGAMGNNVILNLDQTPRSTVSLDKSFPCPATDVQITTVILNLP